MIRRIARDAALLSAVIFASAARAGIDVEVGNGDKITGTLDPANELETFRFRVPKGAVISVKAKAAKKGPALHVTFTAPGPGDAVSSDGTAPKLAATATTSGLYSVAVSSQNGISTGDYSLSITWKSPSKVTATVSLGAAGTGALPFAADAGASLTLSVKAAKGSAATATLASLTAPDASMAPLSGVSSKRTVAAGGDYALGLLNSGATAGDVLATVGIKAPKASKKKIALTAKVIGSTGGAAFATVLGAGGGTVAVPVIPDGQPGAEINGSAVAVPAGALSGTSAIIVATSTDLGVPADAKGAGPTVFFGPEGTKFDAVNKAARATVTIPFDQASGAPTEMLSIYTRDAKGKVTLVPKPYTFDMAAGTVSFATSHFSSFRATAPDGGGGGSTEIITVATVTDPEDVCFAFDPDTRPMNPIYFYVAEGSAKSVGALRLAVTTSLFTHELWAGGGSVSTDGTFRTSFKFNDPVQCVYAIDSGEVWIATTTQIFHVSTQGLVQRVAGTGTASDTGDNGPATSATFVSISALLVDLSGNVFVSDAGAHKIRNINGTDGQIHPFAGNGNSGAGADGVDLAATTFVGPYHMSFPLGISDFGIYVADGSRIRQLSPAQSQFGLLNITIAGDPLSAPGSSGDGGPPAQALFNSARGITQDIDFQNPGAVRFLIADAADHTIRRIDLTANTTTLIAGAHGTPGLSPESGSLPGRFNTPVAFGAFPNFLAVCDKGNGRVRLIAGPLP